MLTQNGKLTDIGSWYMGGVSTNNIPKSAASSSINLYPWHCFVFPIALAMFMV
jgi:hypothetical protein